MKKLILILLVFAGFAFSQTDAKINRVGGMKNREVRIALQSILDDTSCFSGDKTASGVWTFSDSIYAAKLTAAVFDCTVSTYTVTGSLLQTGVNSAGGSANPYDYTGTLGIMDGSDNFTLFDINMTNADHTSTGNTVYIMDVANITGDAHATENAIQVGTGWDLGLKVSSPVEINGSVTLANDGTYDNDVNNTFEWNENSDELIWTFGSNTVTMSSSDVTSFSFGTIGLASAGTITQSLTNVAGAGANPYDYTATLGIMDGSDTFQLFDVNITNADHTGGTNVVNVMDVGNITGDAHATETAFAIGTGWDYGLNTSSPVNIASASALTTNGVIDQTIVDIAAGGDKAVNTSITQGSSALTGNLIAGAFVATNGTAAAADGVIYGIEAKARAATSGGTGNTIGRLTGVYASVDAKVKTATTMRAFEASLDGAAGGTSTEAVAFEAFNNSSSTQTASYAFSANGGTASGHKVYTADMRMQNGALIDNAVDGVLEINEASDELKLTFGSNTVAVSSGDVTLFNFGTIDVQSDKFAMNNGGNLTNPHADTLTVTETVFKVAGGLTFKNSPAISITKIVQSGVASGKERLKLTIGGVDYLLFAAADSADIVD